MSSLFVSASVVLENTSHGQNAPPAETTTFLFSGGGTGGHLFPGIALAEELRARDHATRIVFAGSGRGVETTILARHEYEHRPLPVQSPAALRRHPLRFLWGNARALREAAALLRRESPRAVVGLGGFASVPLVWAARRRGIPTVLLEQNTIPGRATRWLSRRASLVCLSFAETAERLPRRATTCLTGNPVRRCIAELCQDEKPGDPADEPVLLILGGSQGARAVNDAVLRSVERLSDQLSGWRIVHQTGNIDAGTVRRRYEELGLRHTVEPFLADPGAWYRRSTLAIARAGATTLAELACAGCPALLVPYPRAVDDHQRRNARVYTEAGAAQLVEQRDDPLATAHTLASALEPLLTDVTIRRTMREAMWSLARPEAARNVADRLLALAEDSP